MKWPYEPYTIHREPRHVTLIGPIPLLSAPVYTLIFEDTPIRRYHNFETADDVRAMLNAAWNLGHVQGTREENINV